jgi:hypothetical protein
MQTLPHQIPKEIQSHANRTREENKKERAKKRIPCFDYL